MIFTESYYQRLKTLISIIYKELLIISRKIGKDLNIPQKIISNKLTIKSLTSSVIRKIQIKITMKHLHMIIINMTKMKK